MLVWPLYYDITHCLFSVVQFEMLSLLYGVCSICCVVSVHPKALIYATGFERNTCCWQRHHEYSD